MAMKDAEVKADIYGFDEAMAKSVMRLTEIDNDQAKILSELDIEEIPFVSLLLMIAKKDKLTNLDFFTQQFLRLRVSLERKGRKEVVLLSTGFNIEKDEKKPQGIGALFSGLK